MIQSWSKGLINNRLALAEGTAWRRFEHPKQLVMISNAFTSRCSKIAETEAVVSVNEKKLLEMHMHMHVQLMQYKLRGPRNQGSSGKFSFGVGAT